MRQSEAILEIAAPAERGERAIEQLARSNDDLKQFAYLAAHDLQEPLRQLTTFCELLRDEYRDRLDEQGVAYIDHAVSSAFRMKALINDLLQYSRVETQGMPLVPTSANDAVLAAIENLALTIKDANASVECARLPCVVADPPHLMRLFQNLIGNAIKYRSGVPPRIRVWVEDQRDEWIFHVQDNGIGIDPQYHSRIFVIFQRLHSREAYDGTGIGLAVCKRIVERFGGRIWVESELGKGSDFCFALPAVAADTNRQLTQGHVDERNANELVRQSN